MAPSPSPPSILLSYTNHSISGAGSPLATHLKLTNGPGFTVCAAKTSMNSGGSKRPPSLSSPVA